MRTTSPLLRLAAAAALLLGACEVAPNPPSTRPQSILGTDTAGERLVVAAAPRAFGYQVLDSTTLDIDGDGIEERLEIAANVERDARGRLIWEHGHSWLVLVRTPTATYPLLERFVPSGGVRAWVLAADTIGARAIVVVEASSRQGEHGAVSIESFTFDPALNAFTRVARVQAAGRGAVLDPLRADQAARAPVADTLTSPARSRP